MPSTVCISQPRGLFDEAAFRAMQSTAYFLNVGRGETVLDDALAWALKEQVIAGAARECP